jgi:hypothetical protein
MNTNINLLMTQSQAMQSIRSVNRMWERTAKDSTEHKQLGSIMDNLWSAVHEAQWQHVDATGSTNSADLSLSLDMTESEITKIQIALMVNGSDSGTKQLHGYLSTAIYSHRAKS